MVCMVTHIPPKASITEARRNRTSSWFCPYSAQQPLESSRTPTASIRHGAGSSHSNHRSRKAITQRKMITQPQIIAIQCSACASISGRAGAAGWDTVVRDTVSWISLLTIQAERIWTTMCVAPWRLTTSTMPNSLLNRWSASRDSNIEYRVQLTEYNYCLTTLFRRL